MTLKLIVHSIETITSKKDGKVYPLVVGFEAPPSKLQQFVKWFLPAGRSHPKAGEAISLDVSEVDVDNGKLTIRATEVK